MSRRRKFGSSLGPPRTDRLPHSKKTAFAVGIEADSLQAGARERNRQRQPDVPQSDNGDPHPPRPQQAEKPIHHGVTVSRMAITEATTVTART